MITLLGTAPSTALFVLLLATTACSTEPAEFAIHVDSLGVPASVAEGTAFEVRFYGPIGPDLCYRFKRFDVSRSAGEADVTVIGESASRMCPHMPAYLDGEALTISPPFEGPFTIRVHQPGGAVLTRSIEVGAP